MYAKQTEKILKKHGLGTNYNCITMTHAARLLNEFLLNKDIESFVKFACSLKADYALRLLSTRSVIVILKMENKVIKFGIRKLRYSGTFDFSNFYNDIMAITHDFECVVVRMPTIGLKLADYFGDSDEFRELKYLSIIALLEDVILYVGQRKNEQKEHRITVRDLGEFEKTVSVISENAVKVQDIHNHAKELMLNFNGAYFLKTLKGIILSKEKQAQLLIKMKDLFEFLGITNEVEIPLSTTCLKKAVLARVFNVDVSALSPSKIGVSIWADLFETYKGESGDCADIPLNVLLEPLQTHFGNDDEMRGVLQNELDVLKLVGLGYFNFKDKYGNKLPHSKINEIL